MKKILKRISIYLLIAVMSIQLSGCGNSDTFSEDTTSTVAAAKGTEDNPFILGVSPMSGWYAWYGIEGTGIFEENGVCVEIQFFPVYSDSLTAFYSGQVDGICIAASDAIAPLNEGIDFKVVLVNDNSYGADGLVVQDSISSIEELKGKSVATEIGTLEHMFLLKILEDNGMTIDDVDFTNMTINDAGPAFIAGSVDAAVLWEPTLSTALNAGGNLLYSTKETPGLIPDALAVQQEVLDSSGEAVQNIVNAWFDGVEMLKIRDEAFIQVIATGAEITTDEYFTMLDGVSIFDKEMNIETFKEGDDYTSLPYTLQASAEFLLKTNMISEIPEDVTSILDTTYIKGAKE